MTKAAPERWLENLLFAVRWLMVPVYLGLAVALAALVWVFLVELTTELRHLPGMKPEEGILMALSLIDLSFAGNLILIVIYSGYENFVSRLDVAGDKDRPDWMGAVDFSGLKMKLIASIVAISAIELLKTFMEIEDGKFDPVRLQWMVIVLLTFVLSGVLLALMDYLSGHNGGNGSGHPT